jgi:hypothetical protein
MVFSLLVTVYFHQIVTTVYACVSTANGATEADTPASTGARIVVVAYDSVFSMAFVTTSILWEDVFVRSIDILSTIFDIYDPVALVRYTEM